MKNRKYLNLSRGAVIAMDTQHPNMVKDKVCIRATLPIRPEFILVSVA